MHNHVVFVQRIGLSGVATTFVSLRGLIILPILTKTLGASEYGSWALIMVTMMILLPFVQLGLGLSTVRFLSSKGKTEIGQGILTVLFMILLTSSVAGLVVFSLSDFIANNILGNETASSLIRIAALLIIVEGLAAITLGSFRIFGQIKRYATVAILQTALEIALIAFFVLTGYGLLGAIVSLLISRGIILLITLYLIFSHAGFSSPDFSLLRPYLAYSIPLLPSALFEIMILSSDRYVIGFFLNAASVGVYSAAYGIGSVLSMFMRYIVYILSPTIFNLYDKGQIKEVKTYLSYSWKYFLLLSIPSAFGLSILAEPLLHSLTTVEFVSRGRLIIPLAALSMILYGSYVLFGQVVLLTRKTRIFAVALSFAAAMNLGLNVLCVPLWGIMAAAVTSVIAYLVAAIIILNRARKYLSFDIQLISIIKSIISSVIMTVVIWVIDPVGIPKILLSIVVGAIIYFIVLYLLRGFSTNELRFIIGLFKGSKKWFRRRDNF